MSNRETYTSMLVGVAFFVGGVIMTLLLLKYLNKEPVQTTSTSYLPPQQNLNVQANIPTNEFFTRTENVTDFITMLYDEQLDGLNWTSFDIVNNGPKKVYFSVNNYDSMESGIQPGQTVSVNLNQHHAIKKVYLKCDTGENANVSFYIQR